MKKFSRKKLKSYKSGSRKWFLVIMVFFISTLAAFVPPLVSVWIFGASTPLVILSGVEYVSIISIAISAYFGANVFQKNVEYGNGVYPNYNNIGYVEESNVHLQNVTIQQEDEGKEA